MNKMNIMTKRGSLDNNITYEHYCDTKADLANIPKEQITLGSVAIVLKDEGNEMGIYIANSSKEWVSFSSGGGGSNMSDISLSNLLDISLANPTDGQTLVYNGETEKWENKDNNSENERMVIVFNITMNGMDIFYSINQNYSDITSYLDKCQRESKPPLIDYAVNNSGSYSIPPFVNINRNYANIQFSIYKTVETINENGNDYLKIDILKLTLNEDNSITNIVSDPNNFIYMPMTPIY